MRIARTVFAAAAVGLLLGASAVWACDIPSPCWMTGGGTKWDPDLRLYGAQHGPKVSFGGNVAPSCSLVPGEGGQWNHVDHNLKWHFQGFQIDNVYCEGIPTNSPDAPVNHIYFSGTGRLDGIADNKDSFDNVCFSAQAIDNSEPGTRGLKDPNAPKDQYFIRITDCVGNTLLVLGDETELVDVTTGNIQIHPCQ